MKLEEIQQAWDQDSKIDTVELGHQSLKTPELHNKYYKMLMNVGVELRAKSAAFKTLYKQKWMYYLGLLSHEELKQLKWEPLALKILRTDVDTYLEADKDLQDKKELMDMAKAKFEFIESVLKTINNRNFTIKNAIDWEKFKNGQ